MFVITTSQDKEISWPVKVEVATDGGKIRTFEFGGTFKLLSDDQRDALAATEVTDTPDYSTPAAANAWKEQAVDNILKQMTGWTGVCNEDKNPIEFNRVSLLAAVRSPQGLSLLRGINVALGEIATGARAKN